MPISTGSGKALYVGTSLPNDGEYHRVKAALVERFQGRTLDPDSEALDDVDPAPLFDRVADRATRSSRGTRRSSKIGKDQFFDYLGDDPVGYAGDDRAQGLAHVERRRRGGDVVDRRAA